LPQTKFVTEPTKRVPVVRDVEVLVAGGGMAGVIAAVAAARAGAEVLLLERYGFLGGMATAGLVDTIPRIVGGLGLEFQKRMNEIGCVSAEKGFWTSWDPEGIKRVCIEMLEEARVELLLHSFVVDVALGESRLKGAIVESKSGRQAIFGKVTVDATGDGDLAARAGSNFLIGEGGKVQPMTLMFNLRNVDKPKARKFLNGSIKMFLKESIAKRETDWKIGYGQYEGQPGVCAYSLIQPDEVTIWGGVIDGLDGTSVNDLTKAELLARTHVARLVEVLRKSVPGFENAVLNTTAAQVGVRESRRIVGKYSISLEDVKSSRKFDDWVGYAEYGKYRYWIPYSILLPEKLDSLLLAGRCVSASRKVLQLAGLREIPNAMVSGQAAGMAAGLCVKKGVEPRELDPTIVQTELIKNKAVPITEQVKGK
jgi:FAD dependent oxidoreductase